MNPDVRNMLLALVIIALCVGVVVVIKWIANWRERRRIQANEAFSTHKGWTPPLATPNTSNSPTTTGHREAVGDILPSLFLMGAAHQAFSGGEEDSREKLLGSSNRDNPAPGHGSWWSGQADTHHDSSSSCSDSDSQSSYDSGSDTCSSDSGASFSG